MDNGETLTNERFAALRRAKEHGDYLHKFWDMREPVCPHCGKENFAGDRPRIYEEGEHDIDCDHCGDSFLISTRVHVTFHTDDQDGMA